MTETPINITKIRGCGTPEIPLLTRKGNEILCHGWVGEETVKPDVNDTFYQDVCELDDVNETKGTASCKYATCLNQLGRWI